jgi:hypothetical protein
MKSMRLFSCLLLLTVFAATAVASSHEVSRKTRAKQEREKRSRSTSSSPLHKLLHYPINIVADTLDCAKASVGIGLGIGARVRATDLAQVGAMAYDSVRVGLNGRSFPAWHEMNVEAGISLLYLDIGGAEHAPTEFGGAAHVALVGASASVDPVEIIDLIATLFFLDPLEDNL